MVSSMAPSHSLGQGNKIEMQHEVFGDVMPLEPLLHNTHGIITGTIVFLGQDNQMRYKMTFLSYDTIDTSASIT